MLINMVKSKVSKSKWIEQQRVSASENISNWHSSVNLCCLWWRMCRHQCWSLLQCLLTKWCSQILGDVKRHCALIIHAYWNNHLLWAVPYNTGTLTAHILRVFPHMEQPLLQNDNAWPHKTAVTNAQSWPLFSLIWHCLFPKQRNMRTTIKFWFYHKAVKYDRDWLIKVPGCLWK